MFYGFGAFVGSITGVTSCGFWPDDPATFNWDPKKQIPVDLGKNPEAVRRGLIQANEIQCDDFAGYGHGGLTQIGPMWPGGRMTGAVFLEESYYKKLKLKPDRVPPGWQGRDYELTKVLYWDGPFAGRRFMGIHCQVQQKKGSRALVAVWEVGRSMVPKKVPLGTFWIDFARDVLPAEEGFTQVGTGARDVREGAIFIEDRIITAMSDGTSKVPQYLGGEREDDTPRIPGEYGVASE